MIRFKPVSNRSELALEARSSVHPIRSVTTELDGYFEAQLDGNGGLDLSVAPRGRLEIAVEKLKSGNVLIDHAMQGRLDTRRFPLIKAELSGLRATGQNGRYHAWGDISFHGVTQRLEDELIITLLDEATLEIRGQTTVDVRDFKMQPPRLLMLKVEPEVQVRLNLIVKRME